MRSTFKAIALAGVVLTTFTTAARAEGSAEIGANQRVRSTTAMAVDIVSAGEDITWTGSGTVIIEDPVGGGATLASGETFTTTEAGLHEVILGSNQEGAWDIAVNAPGGGTVQLGRLFSTQWRYSTGSFDEGASANGSYYALVAGGGVGQTAVVELRLDGLSGAGYSIGANATGVVGVNAGRSVPVAGNSFIPDYRLYVNPPEIASYSTTTPVISDYAFTGGPAGCDLILPGQSVGQFSFDSNVEGTYHLICDTNEDGQFDRVDDGDMLLVGDVVSGPNTIPWDGTDSDGIPIAVGAYDCIVSVNIGELHYVGDDIETSYEGMRMFSVAANGDRVGLNMFWNDTAVQAGATNMPNGALGLETSGATGIPSGNSADLIAPNVNARSWGDFTLDTKGNNNFLDTYGNLEVTLSTSVQVQTINGADDCDGDGITDFVEACELGTPVCAIDTDGDGVRDSIDIDDDNDGIPDALEGGGTTDTDGDGIVDSEDLDSDNDGLPDHVEAGHGENDDDGDGVLDCADGVGINGLCDSLETSPDSGSLDLDSDSNADEPSDTDGDGIFDSQDLDSDNDGISDLSEGGASCADTEDDGICDADDTDGDGVVDDIDLTDGFGLGGYSPPTDSDGDGTPDFRDLDSDDDGIFDVVESEHGPLDTNGDGAIDGSDSDGDGVLDDVDEVDGFGGANAGTDTDNDGTPDQQETDADNDGVDDADEAGEDPGNPVDTDGDGRPDFQDVDSDNDGVLDTDDNCRVDINGDQFDEDEDGFGQACDRDDNADGFDDALGLEGGGCSTSGGAGGLLLLLLLLPIAVRVRRWGVVAALVVCTVASGNAHAQSAIFTEYNVERFRLATDSEGVLDVEWAGVPEHMELGMALWLGYANDPLNVYLPDSEGEHDRVGALVSDRIGGSLVGTIGVMGRFALGVAVPIVLDQDQDLGDIQMSPSAIGNIGLGDLRFVPKVAILRQADAGLHLGFAMGFTLPTSTEDEYFGESTASLAPELLISRSFSSGLRLALNVGYRFRKEREILNLTVGDEIYTHAGIGYRFAARGGPPLEVDLTYAEATGASELYDEFNQNYSEIKLGASYDIPGPLGLFAATGRGTTTGFGAPDWRALVGLRVQRKAAASRAGELLVATEEEYGRPSAVSEPTTARAEETALSDPWESEGATEPAPAASPPSEPAAHADAKIADAPPPDRDGDGVIDSRDNCPDAVGTEEFRGCTTRQLVNVQDGKLDILDKVYFKTSKAIIRDVSYELLDNVAAVINSHAEIAEIRIEGHTDDRGADAYNKKLSQQRAESVMRYLIGKGVAKGRLTAVGFGEENPIATNDTDEGRTANRRVEFVIVGGSASIEQNDSGPPAGSRDKSE